MFSTNFIILQTSSLQVRPGWRRASPESQLVQLQAETPRAGGGRGRGGGGWWGGGGRQPDREISWWGSWIPITHHSGSVWGGWGGGRDSSLSYELRTHSQVLTVFIKTQTVNTDGWHVDLFLLCSWYLGSCVNLNTRLSPAFSVAQNGL